MSILAARSRKFVLGLGFAWLLLLWPPVVNGLPFMLSDTITYLRSADAASYKLTGRASDWSNELFSKYTLFPNQAPVKSSEPHAKDPPPEDLPLIIAGRSIYYGALLFGSYILGSLWIAVAVQCLLAVICIFFTLERLATRDGRPLPPFALPLVGGLLAIFSPLAYFTGYLMPDIFAAFAILSFAHIVVFWDRDSRARRIFWVGLLTFSILSHNSHLLLVGLLTLGLIALRLVQRAGLRKPPLTVLLACLVVAVVGEAIFWVAVDRAFGTPPVRPPFLAARLIDDGPGYRYLRTHCPQAGFVLCNYLDRMPVASDTFLWGPVAPGVFKAVPPAESRRLANEQGRFVLAVFLDRPAEVIASSAGALMRQASQLGLHEFNYVDTAKTDMLELPPDMLPTVRRSAAFNERMPVALTAAATGPVAILSLAAIGWWSLRHRVAQPAYAAFALIVCTAIALNIAICGSISTPHDRYVMRTIWLLPLVALCLWPWLRGQFPAPERDR